MISIRQIIVCSAVFMLSHTAFAGEVGFSGTEATWYYNFDSGQLLLESETGNHYSAMWLQTGADVFVPNAPNFSSRFLLSEHPAMNGDDWNTGIKSNELRYVLFSEAPCQVCLSDMDFGRVLKPALGPDELSSWVTEFAIFPQGGTSTDKNPTSIGLRVVRLGDFDLDGSLDRDDIALVTDAVIAGSTESKFDVNFDNVVDARDRNRWVDQLRNTYFGDSNFDRQFDSSDLNVVFQAGKYGLNVDATWAEGDWSGDKRFDSTDLLYAFRAGGYGRGVKAASVVPEGDACFGLFFGALVLFLARSPVRRLCNVRMT